MVAALCLTLFAMPTTRAETALPTLAVESRVADSTITFTWSEVSNPFGSDPVVYAARVLLANTTESWPCVDRSATGWAQYASVRRSCTVGGLQNGVTYDLLVSAHVLGYGNTEDTKDDYGPGRQIAEGRSGFVTVCCGVPSVPRDVVMTDNGNGVASVSWKTPDDSGGAQSLEYTVATTPPSSGCESIATSCTISGLSFGTVYTASVTARNSSSESPPGTSIAAVRLSPPPPQAVRAVRAERRGDTVLVTWRPPRQATVAPITAYVVTSVPSGLSCRTEGSVRCRIGPLVPGQDVSFRVRALRGRLAGPWSLPSPPVQLPRPAPAVPEAQAVPAAPSPVTKPQAVFT